MPKAAFDFEIDPSGARLTVCGNSLTVGCLTDGEVDLQVKTLKDELDAVARRMKKAIQKQAKPPLNGGR